jgi:hypothetical protein
LSMTSMAFSMAAKETCFITIILAKVGYFYWKHSFVTLATYEKNEND